MEKINLRENKKLVLGHRGLLLGVEWVNRLRRFSIFNPVFFLSWVFLVVGGLLAIASDSYFMSWVGLELNTIGFIGVIRVRDGLSPVVKIKYFIVQCLSSGIFLVSVLRLKTMDVYCYEFFVPVLVALGQLGLAFKAGLFPIHRWVPSTVLVRDWFTVWIVLGVQKFVPFIVLGVWVERSLVMVFIVGRRLVGSVGGLRQNFYRGLLAYSSIVHGAWLVLRVLESVRLFVVYYLGYLFQLRFVTVAGWVGGLEGPGKGIGSLLGGLGMLRLRGLPPFGGFFFKVLIVISVIKKSVLVFPILGRVLAAKFYLGASVRMLLSAWSFWDLRLKRVCWVFVMFNILVFVFFGHFFYNIL